MVEWSVSILTIGENTADISEYECTNVGRTILIRILAKMVQFHNEMLSAPC